MHAQSLSHVQLFAAPWTPLSMGFPMQEYWSALLLPPPGDLPNPGIKPASPVAPALAGRFFTTEPMGSPRRKYTKRKIPRKKLNKKNKQTVVNYGMVVENTSNTGIERAMKKREINMS